MPNALLVFKSHTVPLQTKQHIIIEEYYRYLHNPGSSHREVVLQPEIKGKCILQTYVLHQNIQIKFLNLLLRKNYKLGSGKKMLILVNGYL